MPPSNPKKSERKHARKKRKLEERQNSYTQITDWNGDLPTTSEAPPKARITNRCMVKRSHVILLALLLILVMVSVALSLAFCLPNLNAPPKSLAFVESRPPPSSSTLNKYQHAAIVSDAAECTEIGLSMLQRNGSAVDAAVATLACVSVVNAQSAGIGGGFLMTLYDRRRREAAALVARESAPAAATEDMFVDDPIGSQYGWRAAGVPGEVAGYWAAHQKYGRLPWSDLFQPTIKLCRDGYRVNQHQAKFLVKKRDDYKDETFRSIFFNATTGEPLPEGAIIRRPVLADTLQAIADGGAAALYGGDIGKLLAEDIQKNGGIITLQDLEDYRVRWEQPVTAHLSGGLSFYGVPAPGSGSLVAFIFNILDGYEYSKHRPETEEELNLMYHRIAEAFKYAYARRTELADPKFVDISELTANLTSPDYAEFIRSRIDDSRTFNDPDHYGVHVAPVSDSGTAHVSVIDADGNAVSVTSTVNLHFGSKVISPRTGILLNNEMDDFSTPGVKNYFKLPPSPSNFIKPGKMMVSSMAPSLFVDADGDIRLVTGASGGTRITSATALTAFRHLYLGEDLKQANDFPRFHHQLIPMTLNYDDGFPPTTVAYLADKGHNMEKWDLRAVVPMLSYQYGAITGVMDYRKGAGDVRGF